MEAKQPNTPQQTGTPNGKVAVLGLRCLLVMYARAVVVPSLIRTGLNFDSQQMTYLTSVDIFMCSVATLLQLMVNKFFEIGLPAALDCTVQVTAPSITVSTNKGVGTIYGSIIVSGIFVVLIAGLFSGTKRLSPLLVTGIIIIVIGLTLVPVAVEKMGGGLAADKSLGDPKNLLLAFVTIVSIIVVQVWGCGFIKSIAMLVGLVGSTILAAFLGLVDSSPIGQATWFHFSRPFYFDEPTFNLSSAVSIIIISIISVVESTGVYFALGDVIGKKIGEDNLYHGYHAKGSAVILGGIFDTFPYTGFPQDVGLVQLSGIKTCRPIYFSVFFLIILGLLSKIGAMVQTTLEPVLGGGTLVMFGMVAVQGIRMLSKVDYSNSKNLLIIAISVGSGSGFSIMPAPFNKVPGAVSTFTSNGVVMSSITTITLDLLFNNLKEISENNG